MDDGSVIQVNITVDKEHGRAVFDFRGTSGVHSGNFNAPSAVAESGGDLYITHFAWRRHAIERWTNETGAINYSRGGLLSPVAGGGSRRQCGNLAKHCRRHIRRLERLRRRTGHLQ